MANNAAKMTSNRTASAHLKMVEHRSGQMDTLVTNIISIRPPDPPSCISFGCLAKFVRDSLFSALLASYHSRRVAYVESKYYTADLVGERWKIRRAGFMEPKTETKYPYKTQDYDSFEAAIAETSRILNKVLKRYRTGSPAPTSIIGAIVANLKLSCPVCRQVETKW
jgi:hypothetical protein